MTRLSKAMKAALLLLLSVTAIALCAQPVDYSESEISVTLYPNGWALVSLKIPSEGLITRVVLPGNASMVSVLSGEGIPLNFTQTSFGLLVKSAGIKEIVVVYLTQGLTRKEGVTWTFNISTPGAHLAISLPKGAVLTRFGAEPSAVRTSNGSIVLIYDTAPSVVTVGYVIPPPVSLGETPRTPPNSTVQEKEEASLVRGLAPALIATVLGGLALVVVRGRKTARTLPELDERDLAILNLIAREGGSIRQNEVSERLNIPKSSTWRRARRLERLGLITIERGPAGVVLTLTEEGRSALK